MEQKLVPGSPVILVAPHLFAGYTGVIKKYERGFYCIQLDNPKSMVSTTVYSGITHVKLSYSLAQQISRSRPSWANGPWQPTEEGIVQAEANLLYKLIRGELT